MAAPLPSLPKLPSSPLPTAPDAEVTAPPQNPLGRLRIGHGGPLPRLRLPVAHRPQLPNRPPNAASGPRRPSGPPAPTTVVRVQTAPAKAPAAPPRPAGARPTAREEREGTRTFLGDRLGGAVNRLPRSSRERLRTLLRDHGREYHAGYHEAGADYLRGKLAERKDERARQAALNQTVAARQREQLRTRAAGIQRTDLDATPPTPPEAQP